jgi:2-oxoglutarate dehydrogenase E1 component
MSNRFSFSARDNAEYLDSLYVNFQRDPLSVDEAWRKFFEGFDFGLSRVPEKGTTDDARNLIHVQFLIDTYRRFGHRSAHLDPLSKKPALREELSLKAFGLDAVDKNTLFSPFNFTSPSISLGDLEAKLQRTYTGSIGVEYLEVENPEALKWLAQKMEAVENRPVIPAERRRRALEKVAAAEGFEKFLHTRFVGQKRFSVEGLDAVIPLLDHLSDVLGSLGAEEIDIGMAHRGRLNVLINYMGKPFEKLVKEFEGAPWTGSVEGDVKYHMGYASTYKTASEKKLNVFLAANPSHLEAVNPVLEGFVRSRQGNQSDLNRKKIIPILLHGDAAFIGQGVVAETLNLSNISGYRTGGTVHIITNNMIGFTTECRDSRSAVYSSDLARMLRAPVFHVNADDVDAVLWTAELAGEYRQKFGQDVLIDLVGYRRHGHNEGEEPSFTQPILYKTIASHPTLYSVYSALLLKEKIVSSDEVKQISDYVRELLQAGMEKAKAAGYVIPKPAWPIGFESIMDSPIVSEGEIFEQCSTKVAEADLKRVLSVMTTVPSEFTLHPKAKKLVETRSAMLQGEGSVDWGTGELLALGTLSVEGHPVRFTGQDSKRGTFTSRHAVFFNFETQKELSVISQLNGAKFDIHNSPLSEAACIGFEWGYSLASPESLVVWEAQFGDFCNGGQILIDQYLVSSEAKWRQTSGLVLLLPHGYEGQGPEHSNARPERFLQLCGANNISVVYPSTPAQHFHALRRQVLRKFRKPLIVLSPKSLLRDPDVISQLSEFTVGKFETLLDDPRATNEAVGVIFCTGKIYYDLKRQLETTEYRKTIAIIRVEQLYPFDLVRAKSILSKYKQAKNFVWAQEEPLNMGAWMFVRDYLEQACQSRLTPIGRPASGSTAEGSTKSHNVEQTRILNQAIEQVVLSRANK